MKSLLQRIVPIIVLLSMFIGACVPQFPIVPVTGPKATATSLVAQTGEVWDRIVTNKKIVVGTSWDYPPFASVDPDFKVVGFDIALIQEIGRRLNYPVVIQNFTFEGLPGALQLNQIDLAVAAISITPERKNLMAFSPVYYVNQTAILAKSDSTINISDFSQLATLRVGVQSGSTYETMMQSLLVDSGMMNPNKLISYVLADEAVNDLVANKLDLVVTGEATASYYVDKLGLQMVGKGFNQQDLAIAIRLDSPRLEAEIDRVMKDMLADGTISGLIEQYMQNDPIEVLPTAVPTNQPTVTPVPPVATVAPPACIDGMKFVSDITYNDYDMTNLTYVKPGDGFVKTWRVLNTGSCIWTSSYRLLYAYGNVPAAQMKGQPVNISGNVAPGQTTDISVNLVAPLDPATYQGFWQIENASGVRFGQTIWVGITTKIYVAAPPATVVPPAGIYCEVILTAPKTSIVVNSDFDTIWTVKNISTTDWSYSSVDYKFSSGTDMQAKDSYDFTQTIKAGESANIIADMVAPGTAGAYAATWAIVSGSKTLCMLPFSVTVIAK